MTEARYLVRHHSCRRPARAGRSGSSAEIFSRRGFRATSMNEIAAAVGLSKPTLYHYFRSKEELLVRLYSEVLDESLRMARETVGRGPHPPGRHPRPDRLPRRLHLRQPRLLKVCFEEEHELPADWPRSCCIRGARFEDLFVQALTEHLARTPRAAAWRRRCT